MKKIMSMAMMVSLLHIYTVQARVSVKGDVVNIVELAKKNTNFRQEIVTGKHSQVVIMSIPVGGEIGLEVHKVDQTLVFVQGKAQAILDGKVSELLPGYLLFVPAGTQHNVKNSGSEDLKLYTIYAPAQHKPGTIEKTKSKYE